MKDFRRIKKYGHKSKASLYITIAMFCMVLLAACSCQLEEDGIATPTVSADQPTATSDITEIYINMDCKNAELPSRFRTCDEEIDNKIGDKTVDLTGLSDLAISGSGQFSAEGLALLKGEIGGQSIVIIDLRQESHGFVNGIALSWMDKDNNANRGLTMGQVEQEEQANLENLAEMDTVTFPTDGDSQVCVETVQSERELAEELGLSYVRLPVTNNEKPTDEVVDAFIEFVNTQPADTWLHFHCMEGVGRATMFMVMYDTMKNAKTVELEDIMDRQVMLGGKNLLHSGSKDRAAFIESFYQYCRENDDGFKTIWSQWAVE